MKRTTKQGSSTRMMTLLAAALLTACGTETSASESELASGLTQGVDVGALSPGSRRALELAGVLRAIAPVDREAQGCDPSPEVVTAQVCGKTVPASAHFEWTRCQMRPPPPPGGKSDGGMDRPELGPPGDGQGPPDGQRPPPPQDGQGPMQGGALAGRAPPSSTGTVDVTTAVTGNESCDATQTVHFERKSVFNVTHGGPDGGSVSSTGTVTAKSDHAPQAQAFTSTIVIDRNDELKDKTGTVVRSAHLTGTLTVDEDRSSGKPSRTTSGTLSAAKEDGRIDAIELGALVGPGEGCMFPSAGSIKRTAQDGAVTTLVFGATCGEATLDGAAVTLPKPPQMGPPR